MAGLIALFVVGLWFWLAFWFAKSTTRRLKPGLLRRLATFCLTLLYIALPLADEIIGGFQFRAICEKEAFFRIDAAKIKGKKVRSVNEDTIHQRFPIRITSTHFSYRDAETGEELASFSVHRATGGLLARWVAFNTTNPWTFYPTCSLKPQTNFDFTIIR